MVTNRGRIGIVLWISCRRWLIIVGLVLIGTQQTAVGYLGDSPLPPGLNPADVILFEDFESSRTLMDGVLADSASSVTTKTAFSGQACLEMHNSNAGKFSSRLPLGGSWDRLFARYLFRVGNAGSSCWNASQHYKNMGFEAGTRECKGSDYTSNGADCFTVRSRFNYPYLGVHVESAPFPGLFTDLNRVDIADGNWHCLEVEVQLNTPGARDGVIRHWVDGQVKVVNNLEFRTVDSLKIDKWWFTHWANDDWCGPLYLDDLVISTRRIGCPLTTSDTVPPRSPLNLRLK